MYLILLILGAFLVYYAVSQYLKNKPEDFSDLFGKILAGVLGIVAFTILIRGNIPVALILATGAALSWQGSLWSYLRSRVGGADKEPSGAVENMTREKALEILELTGNPTEEEIKSAHHRLMMKIHPDQGGSGYFAAQLNQAKDLLLNK